MLNLITPKKMKKKYCVEDEEDLSLAGVRKVQDRVEEVEECHEMSSLPRVQVENSLLSTIHDH